MAKSNDNVALPSSIDDIEINGLYAATSKLQERAIEIRLISVNWQSYLQGQMISSTDFEFITKYEKAPSAEARNVLIHENPLQCAETFLSMINYISKDQTVQYILTMIDDLLQEDKNRVELFRAYMTSRKESVWAPFFSLLNRPDPFIMNQASRIIAKIACWSSQMMEHNDLIHYFTWLKEQLRLAATNEYIQTVARCLQMMLRIRRYCEVFMEPSVDGVATISQVLNGDLSVQIQYQLIFCLWCVSFDENLAMRLQKYNLIPTLADILESSSKEKVTRITCALFRHLVEKPEDTQHKQENALAMVQCKVLTNLQLLLAKKYDDPEFEEDLEFLNNILTTSVQDLSSIDEYTSEVRSGRLEWSPVHKSEKFWRENAHKLNDRNYELLKILVKLLDSSKEPLVLSVAAHDIGEYVRHYPRGKHVIEQLGAKELVMKMLDSEDSNVRYNALLSLQKIMVHNCLEFYARKGVSRQAAREQRQEKRRNSRRRRDPGYSGESLMTDDFLTESETEEQTTLGL